MISNQLHRRYLNLQEAANDVLGSTGSEKKDIAILPPAQVDAYATYVEEDEVNECHKNDFLSSNVTETLEVHNNDECEVASDVSAIHSKENKPPPKKRERMRKQCSGRRKAA